MTMRNHLTSNHRPVRIGVIADTHGRFDSELLRHFAGVDLILHAGDIGDPEVLRQLATIAPVTAVSGNVDGFARSGHPMERVIEVAGRRIALRHIVFEGKSLNASAQMFLDREQPDVCVFGHTHRPYQAWRGKTLLFNPGSAGPKRFTLPRAVGHLILTAHGIRGEHVFLNDRSELSTGGMARRRTRRASAQMRAPGRHARS